jgi:phospholipid transport system substrate-binding protein
LLRTYAVHVSDYVDVKVAYLPLRSAPRERERVTVRTQVSHGNKPPINVDYRLYQNDGAWKIYDVAVNGIRLVATFRSSVDAEVQRIGIDGLIADLNAKNQQPIKPRD